MKPISKVILAAVILTSCTSNSKQLVGNVTIIRQINDKVARENQLKLTSNLNEQVPNEINLIIGNSYEDDLLPGKIISEYYNEINKNKLVIKDYTISNLKERIYSFTDNELANISNKTQLTNSIINSIKANDVNTLYKQLDTSISNHYSIEDINNQFAALNLQNTKYAGFQLVDSILGIGFKNSENQILLIFKWNANDKKIYGYTVD